MASSLAGQLYRMTTVDRAIGSERTQRMRASFLFDSKQAADMDMQTIFDIGRDGLNELRKVNRRFDAFQRTLFSEAMKDMDRAVQTKEENERLDTEIQSFLFLVGPHFLTRPAGKALEWLIRRFRIEEFNAKDILAAIMPYHETKAFLTMLTIIRFSTEDMGEFGFLVAQRKARRLLDRATLLAQCVIDRSVMAFICQGVFRASRKGLDYTAQHSFYAALMSQYIGQLGEVTDATIQFVMPLVLDGLSLDSRDAQAAAYMALGALCARVTLTRQAFEQTLCAVAQRPADVGAMTMCLAQVMQTQAGGMQPGQMLPHALLERLAAQAGFARALGELAAAYDIGLLEQPLVAALVHYAFLGDAQLAQLLCALIPVVPMASAGHVCEAVVRAFVRSGGAANDVAAQVVDLAQLRFGQQLEDAVGAVAGRTDSADEHRLLYELKSRAAAGSGARSHVVPVAGTRTTLFLSLSHADAGVRLVGARALSDLAAGGGASEGFTVDAAEIGELALDRLHHEERADVLAVVLAMPLPQLVKACDLVPALAKIIADGRPGSVEVAVGHVLAASGDDVVDRAVAGALFPYLLASEGTAQVTQAIAARVADSAVAHGSGWLACLHALGGVAVDGQFNARVVELLAARLAEDSADSAANACWAAQLAEGAPLALAVGARLVDMLAQSGTDSRARAVDVAGAVVAAAGRVLAEQNGAADRQAAAESALVQATTGAAWDALLAKPAVASVAMGALSAVVERLPALGALQPGQWMVEAGDESAYRGLVRAAYAALVSRTGGLLAADGVLIGRLLRTCVGAEWAEFLAATWADASQPAGVRARSLLTFSALSQHGEGAAEDYQVLLPALLVALADEDRAVRAAAVGCVQTLAAQYARLVPGKGKAQEQRIHRYDALYGAHSGRLQYLPLPTAARFAAALAQRADELLDEAWAVRTALARILARGGGSGSDASVRLNTAQRHAAGAFLVSHAAAADALAPRLQAALLAVLAAAKPAGALPQLFPLVAAHVQQLEQQSAAAAAAELPVLRALFAACYAPHSAEDLRAHEGGACWLALLAYAAGGESEAAAWAQQLAFERLAAAGFVQALGHDACVDLTSCLLRVADAGNAYALGGSSGQRTTLRDLFAALPLDAETASDEIAAIAGRLGAAGKGEPPAGKRARRAQPEVAASAAESPLAEVSTLLELVGGSPSLATSAALLPGLFALLYALVAEAPVDPRVPTEYVKQLVLALLLRVAEHAAQAGVVLGEAAVRVDVVVQAIRTSPSPQTHNQALALLAAVAVQQPQAVLHHVMAIFTFMGANVLRQDDAYSFHVIRHTLERVLPPLVSACDGRAEQVAQAGPVLRVFVDALSHIPRHRRMALFSTLVRTMGARAYAAPAVSLLLEKHVARVLKASAAGDAEDRDVVGFALSLVHGLPPAEQVHAAVALAHELVRLPAEPAPKGDSAEAASAAAALPQAVFVDVRRMASRDLRTYRLVALDFAHQLLTSRQFLAAFAAEAAAAAAAAAEPGAGEAPAWAPALLQGSAAQLLELTATLARQQQGLLADGRLAAGSVAETAWRKTQHLAYSVLDDVNALMDRATFVATVMQLLAQPDLRVRRKVLALANARLQTLDPHDPAAIDELLAVVEPIAELVDSADAADGAEEDAVELGACRQAALLCVATAAKRFAAQRPELFERAAAHVVAPASLQAESSAVASAALVALAVLCGELGTLLTRSLPQYLPPVLKHLHRVVGLLPDEATQEDVALLVAALTAVQAVVENMPAFLAPSLPPLFAVVLSPQVHRVSADLVGAELAAQVKQRTELVAGALARCIPPRHLLPAQFAYFSRDLSSVEDPEAACLLADFVGRTAAALPRAQLEQFYKPLFKFFLQVFDSAGQQQQPSLEEAALSAFMRFVVRLNENLFRPLFLSFVEWATGGQAAKDSGAGDARLRVFYRTLNTLFDRLKSIVAPYYSSVLDTTAAQLERFGVSLDSIELQEEASRKEVPVPEELWAAVVRSLYHSALYDASSSSSSSSSQGVWSEQNFRKIHRHLVNQLANTKTSAGISSSTSAYDVYVTRVREFLAPAISQLAVAMGNDAMWKSLNHEVLMKSRSEDPRVRVGSMVVVQAFYERLGEEFLILLPETIPYLAELLEDDDERVERVTQETIKVIEAHLGESLQSYLK
ncbi:snoRNA-binding rRNA-processing protein utp10 [Coemansia erecta]|uniref:U3 small nucleolar RNA-associated protein 10 n=1 Tax=Coemansia erecta TaxID=147472 RepID=A0A9W7XZ95_9FUNG|nr:snoRNA-binding rRNA-processing protein utp10 [Coemansia erecta]